MSYDSDSDVEHDNQNNEAVIPIGSGQPSTKTDTSRRDYKSAIITEADNPTAR